MCVCVWVWLNECQCQLNQFNSTQLISTRCNISCSCVNVCAGVCLYVCVCVSVSVCLHRKQAEEFSTCTCQLPLEAINCEVLFQLRQHLHRHQLRLRQLPHRVSLKLTTAATATAATHLSMYVCMCICVCVYIAFIHSVSCPLDYDVVPHSDPFKAEHNLCIIWTDLSGSICCFLQSNRFKTQRPLVK